MSLLLMKKKETKMFISLDELNNKVFIVTLIKSRSGCKKDQLGTLTGLGLRGIGSQSELKCTQSIYGMLSKVRHLIDIKIK